MNFQNARHLISALGTELAIGLIATLVCSAALAQSGDGDGAVLTPFFAAPIPTSWPARADAENPVLVEILKSSREPTIFLSSDDHGASLLVGADQFGFGTAIPLRLKGYALHIAEGPNETLWIAGYSRPTVTIFSSRRSFAYLAKLDRTGRVAWEREYGGDSERTIQSLVSMPDGNIIVTGMDSRRTWLAKISGDGDIVWERYVGLGKGSAVAISHRTIGIAAIEADSDKDSGSYIENVGFWAFNEAGEFLGHQVARRGIDNDPDQIAAILGIEGGDGAFYISSAWRGVFTARALQLAKIDLASKIVWSTDLPDTLIKPRGRRGYPEACTSAVILLADGDPLVSCVTYDHTILFRLSATTGAITRRNLGSPTTPVDCSDLSAPAKFLKERSRTAVWLIGSPQSIGGACGWI